MAQARQPVRTLNPLSPRLDPAVREFAQRLRAFYTSMNVNLAQAEEILSVDASTFSRYLAGTTLPEKGLLGRLYEAVEHFSGAAVDDDVRQSTLELFYEAWAVKDKDRHALYLLRDEKDAADSRAELARAKFDELRADLRSAAEAKDQAARQQAQDRHDEAATRIRTLVHALGEVRRDLRASEAERAGLEARVQDTEAKLQADVERRWSRAGQRATQSKVEAKAPKPSPKSKSNPKLKLKSSADADAQGQDQDQGQNEDLARFREKQIELLRQETLDIVANRIPEVVRRLNEADLSEEPFVIEPISITSDDQIGQLARAIDEVHQQAVHLAAEQASMRAHFTALVATLSRRTYLLVQRQLHLLDDLEGGEYDPDRLAQLYKLDHLATRMRRNGENLLVLTGEESGRKWSEDVRLLDVVRAGASEVEQYERIEMHDLLDVNMHGQAVRDLTHLLAELMENATKFSDPNTRVTVVARIYDTGGVMLEIDRKRHV